MSALAQLLRSPAVRMLIREICIGVTIGIITIIHKYEQSKRLLLHMQKRPHNSGIFENSNEMPTTQERNKTGEEGQIWSRERDNKRDYM